MPDVQQKQATLSIAPTRAWVNGVPVADLNLPALGAEPLPAGDTAAPEETQVRVWLEGVEVTRDAGQAQAAVEDQGTVHLHSERAQRQANYDRALIPMYLPPDERKRLQHEEDHFALHDILRREHGQAFIPRWLYPHCVRQRG